MRKVILFFLFLVFLSGGVAMAALVDNGDTVTDTATGLMWQKATAPGTYTWQQAMVYAEALDLAGHTDWRLPNRNELQSLVDYSRYNPSIDPLLASDTVSSHYWSSTTNAYNTYYAWLVYFYLGNVYYDSKSSSYYVRAVRGGQSEQTPPVRSELTEVISFIWPNPASRAIVITHGWSDNAAGWVKEMSEKICSKIGASPIVSYVQHEKEETLTKICQANNWDVLIVDWRGSEKGADTGWNNPMGAYVNAIGVGQRLASILKGKDYSHIHFIAHSAGANLIDFATIWLKYWVTKENRPTLEIHETFLDAYDPVGDSSRYGKQADWADNYIDTRPVGPDDRLDGTMLFLKNGYNIDVTPNSVLDNCLKCLPPYTNVWKCRHNRPYRFYGLSVSPSFVGEALSAEKDPINGTGNMGYPLSLENGHSLDSLKNAYQPGKKCVMNGGICYPGSLPPSVWTFLRRAVASTVTEALTGTVSYMAGAGGTLFNSIKLGVISLLPGSSLSLGTPKSTTLIDSPSWIRVLATTNQPVNTLRFNWRFAAVGEGFLRVFVDGIMVREIDQRNVTLASLASEEVYVGGASGTLAPGTHRIAFRLDGFGTSASGVELTNVELGIVTNKTIDVAPIIMLLLD